MNPNANVVLEMEARLRAHGLTSVDYQRAIELFHLKESYSSRETRVRWLYKLVCEWDNFRYGAEMSEDEFAALHKFLFEDCDD